MAEGRVPQEVWGHGVADQDAQPRERHRSLSTPRPKGKETDGAGRLSGGYQGHAPLGAQAIGGEEQLAGGD